MGRINVALVVGGRFHDFDFARLELLKLLAEHDDIRVRVFDNYEDTARITSADCLVTYTCDVRPGEGAQRDLADWVTAGNRIFALHGTNSALDLEQRPVKAPRCFPLWAELLGSQFVAHPPIHPYRVDNVAPDHWLTTGIEPFETDDELYVSEYHGTIVPLLQTRWTGDATGFEEAHWPVDDPRLVAYSHPYGAGEVLYLTLGHCRSKYDMQPYVDVYPKNERGSWEVPQYYELLRRGLRWTAGMA